MFKRDADRFLNEQLQKFIDKAKAAKTDEDVIRFTDEAHKLYITLGTYDGFDTTVPIDSKGIPQ